MHEGKRHEYGPAASDTSPDPADPDADARARGRLADDLGYLLARHWLGLARPATRGGTPPSGPGRPGGPRTSPPGPCNGAGAGRPA